MTEAEEARAWLRICGVVSDLYGVIYRGKRSLEGSIEAFRAWRKIGIPFCFVTNNSSRTVADIVATLARFGLSITDREVITSAEETAHVLRSRWTERISVYVIGADSLKDAVARLGMKLSDRSPAAVVMGLDREISHEKMRLAMHAALGGAVLIGTSPDLLLPTDQGFEQGAGSQLAAVAAASGVIPVVLGKPEVHMIEAALGRLGTARSETIMIGDQVPTDIRAGRRAALCTVLVTTGVPFVATPSLDLPDFIVRSLLEIPVRSAAGTEADHR
jgi:4-nitrophenyl phosphatase